MKTLVLCLFFFISHTLYAALSIEVETKTPSKDQAFHLVLKTDGPAQNSPDWSPLTKDFIVAGTEENSQYTMINGHAKIYTEWILLLLPKKTGALTIPALQIGKEKTTPIQVIVEDKKISDTTASSEKSQTVMMKTEVSDPNPYVHQEVIYTVKLYHRERLVDASYIPPEHPDTLIIPFGQGRRYQTVENGNMYVVDEQKYAVFPEKSGQIAISSPQFRAIVYEDIPEQISLKVEPILLNVKPIPKTAKAIDWIPAKTLTLEEKYEDEGMRVMVGKTITRILTLNAKGLPAALLPTPLLEGSDAIAVYPEKPIEKNILKTDEIIGKSIIKVTYLLNQPGKVTVPAIEYPWFNTATGKEEIAKLPERVLTVAPKKAYNNTSLQTHKTKQTQEKEIPSAHTSFFSIPWILSIFFAFAWGITLLILYRILQKTRKKSPARKNTSLKTACFKNDPYLAKEALLIWAHQTWKKESFFTLEDIAKKTDRSLKTEILSLAKNLYHPHHLNTWDGTLLWKAFVAFQKRKKRSATITKKNLPPLNPEA